MTRLSVATIARILRRPRGEVELALPVRYRYLIVFCLIWAMVGAAFIHLQRPALGIDDALIFMVYGKHLAAGMGAVYTQGGEHVEGFSSPLWLLIVAGAFTLTAKPEVLLLIVSVLVVAGGLTALWRLIDETERVSLRGLLLIAWTLSSPGFVIWTSLTLMDSALWSSVLMLGAAAALRVSTPRRLALAVALIVLTRSEGLVWSLGLIGVAALVAAAERGRVQALREARIPLLSYVGVLVGLLAFRMAYFGYPFPNTYYAKVSPDIGYNLEQGIPYLLEFVGGNPLVLAVGALPWVVARPLGRWLAPWLAHLSSYELARFRARLDGAALLVCIGLLAPVWTGGDHFGLYRFYESAWPLFVLPLLELLRSLRVPLPGGAGRRLVILAIMLFLITPALNWFNHLYAQSIYIEFFVAEQGRRVGGALNTLFGERPPSVGIIAAGGVALEYHGPVIDVMGLNNLAMAHAPGDRHGVKNHAAFNPEIFLAQAPDLFLPLTGDQAAMLTRWRDLYPWQNGILRGMLDDPRFKERYVLATISNANTHVLAYVRRAAAPRLQGEQVMIVPVNE